MDYAGKFKHWKVVTHLIKSTIKLIEAVEEGEKIEFTFPEGTNLSNENLTILLKDNYLRSNLLFWACCLDEEKLPSE